nr:hypothetical protein DVCFWOQF_DVCFWOQF_CDS_0004 [Microvirus sp.]
MSEPSALTSSKGKGARFGGKEMSRFWVVNFQLYETH